MYTLANHTKEKIMGREQQSNKEKKKEAALSPKEKKQQKEAKKNAKDVVPMGNKS
jgi:ribosomal protein S25